MHINVIKKASKNFKRIEVTLTSYLYVEAYVIDTRVASILASMEASSDYMSIISTIPGKRALTWHLTYQGWSAGSGEQQRHTNKHFINLYIEIT